MKIKSSHQMFWSMFLTSNGFLRFYVNLYDACYTNFCLQSASNWFIRSCQRHQRYTIERLAAKVDLRWVYGWHGIEIRSNWIQAETEVAGLMGFFDSSLKTALGCGFNHNMICLPAWKQTKKTLLCIRFYPIPHVSQDIESSLSLSRSSVLSQVTTSTFQGRRL